MPKSRSRPGRAVGAQESRPAPPPPPPPPPGDRVRLRDVTLADADLMDELERRQKGSGGFNDFGQERARVDLEALARGRLRNDRNGVLLVERMDTGTVIGMVSWHQEHYGPNPESIAWNMGIELVEEARGQGFGREAQRLLADWLLATTAVNRVEASTDVENVAEQRSLEQAGFTREGILRGAQFRAGGYHDLVNYSRLRSDPR